MTTPLENLILNEPANSYVISTAEAEARQGNNAVKKPIDSIASAASAPKNNVLKSLERPQLPAPKASKQTDYMTELAVAFAKVFSTMSKGVIGMTADFTQLQKVSEIDSTIVLKETKSAIDKEESNLQLEESLAHQEKEQAATDKDLQIIFGVIGGVILVASIVSALWTAGASLLSAPEDVAMMTGAAEEESGLAVGEEEESIQMTQFSKTPTENPAAGVGSVSDLSDESELTDTEEVSETESEEEDTEKTTRSLEKADTQNARAVSKDTNLYKVATWCGRRAVNITASAILNIPSLVQGIAEAQVSAKESDLESAQRQVGQALAKLSENNMYFQFYQQTSNRQGSVLNQQVEETSQVIGVYSEILSAVRMVSYGLANIA